MIHLAAILYRRLFVQMHEAGKQDRVGITTPERIFGGVTIALFIVGAIGFIIGVASAVVDELTGTVLSGDVIAAIVFNVAIWAGLLALVGGDSRKATPIGKDRDNWSPHSLGLVYSCRLSCTSDGVLSLGN